MKIVKASNGQETVKMSKAEWEGICKQAGWMTKEAVTPLINTQRPKRAPYSKVRSTVNTLIRGLQDGLVKLEEAGKNNPNITQEEMAQYLATGNGLNVAITTPIIKLALSRPDDAAESLY